jgi:hypothetical protein
MILTGSAAFLLAILVGWWSIQPSAEERRAIEIARKAVPSNSWMTYRAERTPEGGWVVFGQRWPRVEGGGVIVVIDEKDNVMKILYGK